MFSVSREEFFVLTQSNYMNCSLKVLLGLDGRWKCERELSVFKWSHLLNGHFDFVGSLQKLKLTKTEFVLLNAITILAPGKNMIYSSLCISTTCSVKITGTI